MSGQWQAGVNPWRRADVAAGVTASRGVVTPRLVRFGGLRSATGEVIWRESRFVAEPAGVRELVGVLVGCCDWQKP